MSERYLREFAAELDKEFPDAPDELKLQAMRELDRKLLDSAKMMIEKHGIAEEEVPLLIDDVFRNGPYASPPVEGETPEYKFNDSYKLPTMKRQIFEFGQAYDRFRVDDLDRRYTQDGQAFIPDMLDEDPKVAELGSALSPFVLPSQEAPEYAVSSTAYDAAHGRFDPVVMERLVKAVNEASYHPFVRQHMGQRSYQDLNRKTSQEEVADFLRSVAIDQIKSKSNNFKDAVGVPTSGIAYSGPQYHEMRGDVWVHSPLTGTTTLKHFYKADPVPGTSLSEVALTRPREVVEATGIPTALHESGVVGDMLAPGSTVREWVTDPYLYLLPGLGKSLTAPTTAAGNILSKLPKIKGLGGRVINTQERNALLNLYRRSRNSQKYQQSPAVREVLERQGLGPQALGEDLGLGERIAAEIAAAEDALSGVSKAELKTAWDAAQDAAQGADDVLNAFKRGEATLEDALDAQRRLNTAEEARRAYVEGTGAEEALNSARREAAEILGVAAIDDLNASLQDAAAMMAGVGRGGPVKGRLARWWAELSPLEREAAVAFGNDALYFGFNKSQLKHLRVAPFKNLNRGTRRALEKMWNRVGSGEPLQIPHKPPPGSVVQNPRTAGGVLRKHVGPHSETELAGGTPYLPALDDVSAETLKTQLGPTRPTTTPRLGDFIEDITGERKILEELTVEEARALAMRLSEAEIGAVNTNIPQAKLLNDFIRDLNDPSREVYLGRTFLDYFRDPGRMISTKLGPEGKHLVRVVDRVNNNFLRAVEAHTQEVHRIFKGIRHGSPEDVYIAARLDGHKMAEQLAQTFTPERLAELNLKVEDLRLLYDQMLNKANITRATIRQQYGLSEKQLPPVGRVENYLTHVMTDPHLKTLWKEGAFVPEFVSETFNRFFQPRKGTAEYSMSAIDAANAYFPTALKSVYWDPVTFMWQRRLKPNIPTGGPQGKKIGDMTKFADEWLDYARGKATSIGRMMETMVENPVHIMSGSQAAGTAVRRGVQKGSNVLTSMVYFNTLGMNVAAAMSNATQAFNALLKYPPIDFLPAVMINMSNTWLVDKVMSALRLPRGKGVLFNRKNFQNLLQTIGTRRGGLFHQVAKPKQKALRIAMDAALKPFDLMEHMVRRITAMTSVANGVRQGLPMKDIIRRARRDIAYMQFDFTPVGQLSFLRSSMGRGIFQYARFPIQQTDFFLSELAGGVGKTLKGVAARDALKAMDPAVRWGVYAGSVYSLAALGGQVGIDIARAFPAPVTELGKSIAGAFGIPESEDVPAGQKVWDYLPSVGPLPNVMYDLFGERRHRPGVTGMPRVLEGILVPRPIRSLMEAEKARTAGEIRDSRERFLKSFEDGSDLSSFWSAFWSSPEYRRLALGFPSADMRVRYQRVGEAGDAGQEWRDLKSSYTERIVSALMRNDFDSAVELAVESMAEGVKGPDGKTIRLWGDKRTRMGGRDISPREDMFESLRAQIEAANLPMEHRVMRTLPSLVRKAWAQRLYKRLRK